MKIRRATIEDLAPINHVEQRSFQHPWTKDQLAYEIENNPVSRVFVSVDDHQVSGYIFVHDTGEEVQIINIAVDPEYRKLGFGKRLLNFVLNRYSKYADVFLEVRASNCNAIQLYIAAGFYEIGRRQDYYQGGEDALVLKLEKRF